MCSVLVVNFSELLVKVRVMCKQAHLVVDHAAAELLAGGPHHLGVVPRARVELVGADGAAVKPGVRDLVVPGACAVLPLPSHPCSHQAWAAAVMPACTALSVSCCELPPQ